MTIAVGTVVSYDGACVSGVPTDHTVDVGSSTDRGLLVGFVAGGDKFPLQYMRYAGVDMTIMSEIADSLDVRVTWCYLSNPTAGSNTLSFLHAAGANGTFYVVAVPVTGAHQTTASLIRGSASGTGTSNSISDTITSGLAGDLILDIVEVIADGVGPLAANGSQIQLAIDQSLNAGSAAGGASSKDGAASVTMAWTGVNVASSAHLIIAVAPSAFGATPPIGGIIL